MRFETVFEKRVTRSIEDWLEQLGLARYADAFVAAEIDLDVVADLTDRDLVELGVVLGDRKRILRASAKNVAAPLPQNRHPSVVYCDLVEATDLAVRLDPLDLRAVMAEYHARCAGVIAAHGGEAQYLGGGVMVRFAGGPADAEDAERATRCALALIAAMRESAFAGPTRLQTRIGIATGSEADSATASLAARLQRFADPDCVLVADATHRLLRETFAFTPLGSRSVTGLAERVEVWRVDTQERVTPPVASEAASAAAAPPSRPPEPSFGWQDYEDGREPLEALHHWQSELERAERLDDRHLRLDALHAIWTVAFSIGDLSYTLDATARGVTLYDSARYAARQSVPGEHDAGLCAAGHRARALVLCGRIAEGRSWLRRVETALARSEDVPTRCTGALEIALVPQLLGEYDVAIARAHEARKLASTHRFAPLRAHAGLISATARIGMGDCIAGTRALANELDEPGSALAVGWRPYYLACLALAEIAAGNDGPAAARLTEAQTLARTRGGCVAAVELERAAAALLQLRGAPAASVAERLGGAAQLARTQLASLLELRAVSDSLELALTRPSESPDAALLRIRHVLARIEGGEDTYDVRRARALERRAVNRA